MTLREINTNKQGGNEMTAIFKTMGNNEGGDSMEKMILQFKVSGEDMDYLQDVVKIGKKCEVKKFSQLATDEKSKVLGETFALKLVDFLKSENRNHSVTFLLKRNERNELELRVQKNVTVKVEGEQLIQINGNLNFVAKSQKMEASVNPMSLVNFYVENDTLTCKLIFNKEEIEEKNIIAKVSESKTNIGRWENAIYSVCSKLDDVSYLKEWHERIQEAGKGLEKKSAQDKILSKFFDVLSERKLTVISGAEVVTLAKIFANAEKHFPLFKRLWIQEQVEIITQGYFTARAKVPSGNNNKDIYVLARYTFEVMRTQQLHLEIYDDVHRYTLVEDYCRTRKFDNKVYEKKALIWSRYEYKTISKVKIKKGFGAVDLWKLLNSSNCNSVDVAV